MIICIETITKVISSSDNYCLYNMHKSMLHITEQHGLGSNFTSINEARFRFVLIGDFESYILQNRMLNEISFVQVLLTPTHLAIVLEYASGGELFERICTAGRFSEDEVI